MRFLILIFSFSLIILFSCSQKESRLVFAVGGAPSEIDYWENLIKEFQKKTHIKVKIIRQPTDTDQRRQSLVIPLKAKKNNPDVFLMDVVWVAQFAASEWLLPLDSFIQKDNFDITKFFRSVIEQVDIYKNQVSALPVYIDCGLLYFRKDLLERHGYSAPETWEELLQYADEVQKEERKNNPFFSGFVWQGAQYEGLVTNFVEFIASYGGSIIDKTGKVTLNSKENKKALQFMVDLIHKYQISPPNTFTEMKEEEVRLFFENGNALFERNWPYAWKLHVNKKSPVNGKVGMVVLPKFKGGKHAAALGGWHIGISKYSDSQDDAWELVKFILSYNTQKRLALDLGWNTGRKDIYDDPEVKEKMPQMEILKKAFGYAVARPTLPYYSQISEILQVYVNSAMSKRMTPDEALKQAQEEINKIIQVYHE